MIYQVDLISLIIKTHFRFESLTHRSSNFIGVFNEQDRLQHQTVVGSHCLGSEPK